MSDELFADGPGPLHKPGRDAGAAQRAAVLEALLLYGVDFTEFSRRFGSWLALHSTDAAALLEISKADHRDDPLTPSRLGQRISLSSGATTALINRLEQAGHVVRSREGSDRRAVTLRCTPQVDELADQFFEPLATRLDVLLSRCPTDILAQFEALLLDLHVVMSDLLQDARGPLA